MMNIIGIIIIMDIMNTPYEVDPYYSAVCVWSPYILARLKYIPSALVVFLSVVRRFL